LEVPVKRGFLRWFYLAVQFVMLAVSIPKVATLFHAYDKETFGLVVGGIDMRSWLVGIAIDLTATFTTWAAMAKYDETRKRSALFAPAIIIMLCTALSVVANYEDAATLAPGQYAGISIFEQPALFFNPILISAPPVLVLLLILLVPSVLARPRIKSSAEIAAEADEQAAMIEAGARLKEIRAHANARVMGARLGGLADNMSMVAQRAGLGKGAQVEDGEPRTVDADERAPRTRLGVTSDPSDSALLPAPTAQATRAMWNAMSLKDRVLQSGVISASEVSEVLGVSLTRAREILKGVRTPDDEKRAVHGRSGVPYQALIDSLYERKTPDSFAQAQKLEKALGLRRRQRLQPVPDAPEETLAELAE
jgi:hypothetical protein